MSNQRSRIVITDSGLGGFSICAEIARLYANYPLDLIYFNAQPEYDGGYNNLPTQAQKQCIFEHALQAMQQRYTPSSIVIACNTLSVLYTQTQFYQRPLLPVYDIINCGVETILTAANENPAAYLLLLGTLITIESQAHQEMLIAAGVEPERIFAQACPRVAILLEHDLDSPEMKALLESFLIEACGKIPDQRRPLLVALCCTHYPYILDTFEQLLQKHYRGPVTLLNPNHAFAATPGIIPASCQPSGTSQIKVSLVSLVPFPPDTQQNIGAAIAKTSPACAAALNNYRLIPDLFEISC